MAATFQAAGAAVNGAASVTAQWPTHQSGDLGILVIETGGEGTTLSPAGWTHFPGSPVVDVTSTAGSKLHVLWKRAESSAEQGIATGDSGDHQVARIYTFRDVRASGNPYDVTTTAIKTPASTSVVIPSITTTQNDELVVAVVGRVTDTSSITQFGLLTSDALIGEEELGEAGTTAGHGGGFVVATGLMPTAGATGTGTMTVGTSTTNTMLVFAFLNEANPTVVLNTTDGATTDNITFTGTDVNGDALTYEIQIDTLNTFNSN